MCKCGQHQRTNFSECILNKKNIHKLDKATIDFIENNYKKLKNNIQTISTIRTIEDTNSQVNNDEDSSEDDNNNINEYSSTLNSKQIRNKNQKQKEKKKQTIEIDVIEEKTGGTLRKPLFSICCAKAKVKLPPTLELPILIKKLLECPKIFAKY
jgi:hypothetical protein